MKELILTPARSFKFNEILEIWSSRELFYIFAWRDIKVRYKQTILGITWVVLQPLASMVIFTVLFGKLAKIPSGSIPYSLFVLSGLIFWTFFSNTLSHSNESLLANENIIKKVYFPKMILPLSSLAVNFIDFIVNSVLLFLYALILGFYPGFEILYIYPFAILLSAVTSCGIGLFISALNVKYRDVRYILPFFIQILFFVTPIIFPLSMMSLRNRYIIALNPMTSVVESVRVIFGSQSALNPQIILISSLSAILMFFAGFLYFRKTERYIADII